MKQRWTAEAVKALREKLGWSQERLAQHLHATSMTIWRWENGVSRPTGAHPYSLDELAKEAQE